MKTMKLEENNKFLNENIRKLMKSNTKANEKKRLTRKEKEELVKKLYEQGYTYREIAKKLRISVRDISRILKGEERKDEKQKSNQSATAFGPDVGPDKHRPAGGHFPGSEATPDGR